MVNRKKRICFVIQRFGAEIIGGAETLCAQYIEQLKDFYDIDVLTSCSMDYNTWENDYQQSVYLENGFQVYRYRSVHPRNNSVIAELTEQVYQNPYNDLHTGSQWIREVGPYCLDLINHIKLSTDYYDLFVFMGYHYYPSAFGMPLVPSKSIFIPTAHDEEPLRKCNYFRYLFNIPRAIIYLTETERQFVQDYFNNKRIESIVTGAGAGFDEASLPSRRDIQCKFAIKNPYIVYAGRIDETKNCGALFDYFEAYKKAYPEELQLVLMGDLAMDMPKRTDIKYIGKLKESEKFAILKDAGAMVLPSQNESLSIVTLETMAMGTPVLLNGKCDVLKQHILKSNAGLYYFEKPDFIAALHTILSNKNLADSMGINGKKYVDAHYSWKDIQSKLRQLVEEIIQ
jgi:Glycosyltransferase